MWHAIDRRHQIRICMNITIHQLRGLALGSGSSCWLLVPILDETCLGEWLDNNHQHSLWWRMWLLHGRVRTCKDPQPWSWSREIFWCTPWETLFSPIKSLIKRHTSNIPQSFFSTTATYTVWTWLVCAIICYQLSCVVRARGHGCHVRMRVTCEGHHIDLICLHKSLNLMKTECPTTSIHGDTKQMGNNCWHEPSGGSCGSVEQGPWRSNIRAKTIWEIWHHNCSLDVVYMYRRLRQSELWVHPHTFQAGHNAGTASQQIMKLIPESRKKTRVNEWTCCQMLWIVHHDALAQIEHISIQPKRDTHMPWMLVQAGMLIGKLS